MDRQSRASVFPDSGADWYLPHVYSRNFGLGLTGIGSVPYEDTAEFNTQFNSDLNDIFLYMDYQDVFGADSSIDLSRRMLKMTFGPSETEISPCPP